MSGPILGSLLWKSQLLLLAFCTLLVRPSRRIAAEVFIAVAAQVALVCAVFGSSIWFDYASMLFTLNKHPEVFAERHQFISLRAGLELLLPHWAMVDVVWWLGVAAIVTSICVLGQRLAASPTMLSAITIGGLLLSPHAYSYDAILVSGPVLLLLGQSLDRRHRLQSDTIAYLLHWSPILLPLAAVVHVQFTCWLACVWLALSVRESNRGLASEAVA